MFSRKGLIRLLYARVKKDEIRKKHPDWLVKQGPIWFLKEGIDEKLKRELIRVIVQKAKEENYYLYDEIMVREMPDEFCVIALAYPRFTATKDRELKPPKLTHEEFLKIVEEKIAELNPIPYSSKNEQISTN